MALQLKRLGIERVRPLQGGLQEWLDLGFPTVEFEALVVPETGETSDA